MSIGLGQQCDSFLCRYAVRCREFRGLRWYRTSDGYRAYCSRHAKREEALGAVPAPGGPLADADCTCPWYHADGECPIHGSP